MKRLNYTEMRKIAECFDYSLEFDRDYLLSDIGMVLISNGIDYKEYGFLKCIDFLMVCPSVEIIALPDSAIRWYARYLGMPSEQDLKEAVDRARNLTYEDATREETLFEFAYFLPSKKEFLERLANTVLPECWNYPREDSNYEILALYLAFTFKRLHREGKIWFSEDKSEAIINTGLVNKRYEDIYIKFELNRIEGRQPYVAKDILDESYAQKNVSKMPDKARFYDSLEDLTFDTSCLIDFNYSHIIIDNIDRFPLSFLEKKFFGNDKAIAYCNTLKFNVPEQEKAMCWNAIRSIISNDSFIYNDIRSSLEHAVKLAYKKIKVCYRTVLPCYYPKKDMMAFLLPLSFTDMDTVDLTLVVQRCEGKYVGVTVLTKIMAYVNARLISSMNSDWLNTEML